jgi:hypothetical protein
MSLILAFVRSIDIFPQLCSPYRLDIVAAAAPMPPRLSTAFTEKGHIRDRMNEERTILNTNALSIDVLRNQSSSIITVTRKDR